MLAFHVRRIQPIIIFAYYAPHFSAALGINFIILLSKKDPSHISEKSLDLKKA